MTSDKQIIDSRIVEVEHMTLFKTIQKELVKIKQKKCSRNLCPHARE